MNQRVLTGIQQRGNPKGGQLVLPGIYTINGDRLFKISEMEDWFKDVLGCENLLCLKVDNDE